MSYQHPHHHSDNNNPSSSHHASAAAAATAELESNKRAALAGQWRTPPMPAFPTTAPAAAQPQSKESLPPIPSVSVSQLPGSAEDYAKALQEAYLRGAEAAAAMAAGGTVPKPTEVAKPPLPPPATVVPAPPAPVPATSTTMPPPPPPAVYSKPPPPAATTTTTTTTPTTLVPNPLPPAAPANNTNPSRAMSLPDMTTYAAQQEEEKRQKRLARNRASARLRRLRKKNLVDAYEQEVGILEKTLEQLKAHEWGKSDNAGALAEALSMDRGQQVLDMSERQKEAAALLQQQLEWVHMLEDILMEDYVLHQLVDGAQGDAMNAELQELAASLQLSPEQMRQVQESRAGWQDEWDALQTVKASLVAMQQNEWLWNESVGGVAEQFMSILHKNQISKFLLWADANAEAIDELDGVHASQGVPSGPVFAFGVESHPEGFNEEDK